MKIKEFTVLKEYMGNLTKLNAPKLLNALKQDYNERNHGVINTHAPGKFISPNYRISSTSEIIDVGPVKNIADIRKAYRKIEKDSNTHEVAGLALKIGNTTVLMATTNSYNIAGPSRISMVAWDFEQFKKFHDEYWEEINADKKEWNKKRPTPTSSSRDKEERDWSVGYGEKAKYKKVHYTGTAKRTEDLKELINEVKSIADKANQPMNLVLIMRDDIAIKKQSDRYSIKVELNKTGDTLLDRLTAFKNSKKPKANNIREFVDASMKKLVPQIQFAGKLYNLSSDSKVDITGEALLKGKPFYITYKEAGNPYGSDIKIGYVYDINSGGIVPIVGSYVDYTKPSKGSYSYHNRVNEVLDPVLYAKKVLGISDPNDKKEMITSILEMIKNNDLNKAANRLSIARQLGHDWPELDVVQKSLIAAKKKEDEDD